MMRWMKGASEAETSPRHPSEDLASPPYDAATAAPGAPAAQPPVEARGWLARMREGLSKSSTRLTDGINQIFDRVEGGINEAVWSAEENITAIVTKRRLDEATLQELEEILIAADLGPATAAMLTGSLRRTRLDQDVSSEEVRTVLAQDIARILEPVAKPLLVDAAHKPHVILVVGVNGSGKTTTVGKLARLYRAEGRSVMLVAGDTFRAAAVEQLKIWGERTGAPVVSRETGGDPAGLAFQALTEARDKGIDVLLIDTAGRLHNKANLMAELEKIIRVLRKIDPTAPHDTLLVLDAGIGQNAHAQVEAFRQMTKVTGLVVTKLDGTARGGVLVALAERFGLPVHAIGVGERAEDMRPFEAAAFARSLMGLPA